MLTSRQQSSLPMPIPNDNPIDPDDLKPRRIPKLAVRKYIEGLEPPPHLRNVGLGLDVQSPQRTNANDQDDTITPIAARPTIRPDFESRGSHNSTQSNASDDTTQSGPNPPSTFSSQARSVDFNRGSVSIAPSTKKSGVFRFLTLKEPSTSAWEEFAELQKREQALRGAQGKALPEKKLPDTIPKVNSKWNGLPNHVQPPKGHKPWKSSLDISRTTISRGSRTSDESKGSDRPSSGHSSNSSRTVRKANSKGSDKADSVKTVKSNKTVTSSAAGPSRIGPAMSTDTIPPAAPVKSNKTVTPTAAGLSRVGPAMSTDSIPPASPAPASMPARSLFFAPEQSPPTHTSRTILVPDSGNTSPPDSVYADSPTLPNFPKAPTSSPAGGSSTERLSKTAAAADPVVSDEETTPIQENVQTSPPSEHHRSASDITLAPPSPVTPDLATPLGPHNYHNRFAGKKQFKNVEEIPQWPLPTKPDEVTILDNESSPLMTGYQSHTRGESSSSVGSPIVQGFDFSQTDGPSDEPSSPISPIPPSNVVRLHETSPEKAPPASRSSTSRPMFPFKSKPLIAPAFLPGRVKTRPFDLDTIAESDAGSIRAPSLYIVPDRNSSAASVITLKAEDDAVANKSPTLGASSDSTLTSMQRLGLGGKSKRESEYFMGPDGNWTTTEREVERKKGTLMGRFRRGG